MKSSKQTHKSNIMQAIKRTKIEMCKLLNYSEDAYDIMRYELAIAWLQHNDFPEAKARICILSNSFFKWWYQQLNGCERIFIDYKSCEIPKMQLRDAFFEYVLSMGFRPSSPVNDSIKKEGSEALEKNPHLTISEIYNYDSKGKRNGIKQGNKAA